MTRKLSAARQMTPRTTAGSGRKRIRAGAAGRGAAGAPTAIFLVRVLEVLLRGGDSSAQSHTKSRLLQRELHPCERAKHLEVAQPTQVSDPEHLAFELAQADSEREVQALRRHLDHTIRICLAI